MTLTNKLNSNWKINFIIIFINYKMSVEAIVQFNDSNLTNEFNDM